MSENIDITISNGLNFSIEFSQDNRELCEVYEHDGLPVWKFSLLKSLLPYYETLIDFSPSFGLFPIVLASQTDTPISLLLNDENNSTIKSNIDANNISNTKYFNHDIASNIEVTELFNHKNALVRFPDSNNIADKLDNESLYTNFPSLLFEEFDAEVTKLDLIKKLSEMGYTAFTLCPLIEKLIPVSLDIRKSFHKNTVLALGSEKIEALKNNSLLVLEGFDTLPNKNKRETWRDRLSSLNYCLSYMEEWEDNQSKLSTYNDVLDHAVVALYSEQSELVKLNHLLFSYKLLRTIPPDELSFSNLLTAARLTHELGFKRDCNDYLLVALDMLQNTDTLDLNDAFLAPLARYESISSKEELADWLLSSLIESYELNRADSCFNMQQSDAQLLKLYESLPFKIETLVKRLAVYNALHEINETEKPDEETTHISSIQSESKPTEETKPDIAILYHLARTGGTLISKCIGVIEGNILLSELHPIVSVSNPLQQASDWFGLLSESEKVEYLNSLNYVDSIKFIHHKVAEQNKKLIIRDWSHIDFTAVPFVNRCSYQLTQTNALNPYFNIRQIATVRHPVDSYLSVSKLQVVQGKLFLDDYLKGAKEFALKSKEIGFVRYEDFCADPQHHLTHICNVLGINYDKTFVDQFSSYQKITGETTGGRASGSAIKVPKPREIDGQLAKQFTSNNDYWETLEILGYENHLKA